MAMITLRVDDATRDGVERLARVKGLTVSDLLRGAIDGLLAHREDFRDALDDLAGDDVDVRSSGEEPRTLSLVERRTLVMLHQILYRLEPDSDHSGGRPNDELTGHRRQIALLEEGFTSEYVDEFSGLSPQMSARECELAQDILDMFRILKVSVAVAGEDVVARIDPNALSALTFRGFDQQDPRESRLLGYARYLVRTRRWEDLAESFDAGVDRGNSHAPRLATYQRMLAAFSPIWARKVRGPGYGPDALALTRDELAEIVNAWPYPSP